MAESACRGATDNEVMSEVLSQLELKVNWKKANVTGVASQRGAVIVRTVWRSGTRVDG